MKRRARWIGMAVCGALWVYTIFHYLHGAYLGYQGYGDFFNLIQAVRDWLTTGHFTSDSVYLYPPLFYLINAPLAHLNDEAAVRVMLVVNQILLIGWFALLGAALSPPRPARRHWLWMLLPLALNFRPLLLTLSMAKIELLQMDLLLGALIAFQRRKLQTTGVLVAIAGMLKPLPLLLLLYFMWKRQWRVVRGWLLSVVVILGVCGLFVGYSSIFAYFSNAILPRGMNTLYWYEDQSLIGVAVRLFHRPEFHKWNLQPEEVSRASLALGWMLRLVVLCWLGYIMRPSKTWSDGQVRGEWSMAMAGMLLLSPFSRDYYAVFLLLAYALLAQHVWIRGKHSRQSVVWLGVGSYLLVGQGFPLGVISRLPSIWPGVENFHVYLHYGIPTIGYLLLIGAWALALHQGRKGKPRTAASIAPAQAEALV